MKQQALPVGTKIKKALKSQSHKRERQANKQYLTIIIR